MSPGRGGARPGGESARVDIVVNLQDRRPIWAFPDWAADRLRDAVAADPRLDGVYISSSPADGSGDGTGGPPDDVIHALRGARIFMGYGIPPAILEAGGESLQWVHTGTAGVGGSLHPTMLEALRSGSLRFTNSAGIHAPPMAETVLAMLLHFYRGLDFARIATGRGGSGTPVEEVGRRWNPEPFWAADTPVSELGLATVGILGYGGIGREVARRLRPLGTEVLGLRRSAAESARDELGVHLLHGADGLDVLLDGSDALVVCAPETPETRGILDARRLARLRSGALVINVARGSLVDEPALIEALRSGHLRGAALDVFATEPLPDDSPLWDFPNVLITPHVSGVSRAFWRREMELILDNLARFGSGEPLRNQVDPAAGY